MKVKNEQLVYVFIAAIVMAGAILFMNSGLPLTAISVAFVGIIGAFLGVDLMNMIKDTKLREAGDFEPMRKCQYIISALIMAALCIEAFFVSSATGRPLDSVYGSLGVGLMIILGLLVGGIEGNKLVTGKKGDS